MTIKIESTADAHQHGLKMLVHGQAGVGKTRMCATTGDLDHTIILSAEAGLLSLRDFDIDVITIKSIDQMREALSFVAGKRGQKYRWVCIDSLSEIAEVCLSEEMDETPNGLKAYGEMGKTMTRMIRAFRDLPGRNVVMTCKTERIADEGRLVWAPMLPGKMLSQNISYLFDEVFAFRTKPRDDGGVQRFLQTVNDGYYDAKDRSGALDPVEPPSLKRIAEKIYQRQAPAALEATEAATEAATLNNNNGEEE